MKWDDLLSEYRYAEEKEKVGIDYSEPSRNSFERDYDRIIFSSSFRRLGKKTQVHPMSPNDHIHTRLTHSLETASIGRSLGFKVAKKLELDKNKVACIIQSACLAHDIGNPPFGHAGESAIRGWFQDHQEVLKCLESVEYNDFLYWEGNAQAFRILTQIEHHLFNGGMRLTYAVLGAMMKYPWTSEQRNEKDKYGCFWEERNILNKVCEKLKMKKTHGVNFHWSRNPFALLTEAADDVCYRVLDIEDAHELKILSFNEIKELFEVPNKSNGIVDKSDFYTEEQIEYMANKDSSERRRISYLRACFLNSCVDEIVEAFVSNKDQIINGDFQGALIDKVAPKINKIFKEIDSKCKTVIFNEKRKVELELGSYSIMSTLLENFCRTAREVTGGGNISNKSRRICELMGEKLLDKKMSTYQGYLRVMDYIAGMTDDYATYIAKQLNGFGL